MGLDIYAGTLTRYYNHNWKTQAQQFAEAAHRKRLGVLRPMRVTAGSIRPNVRYTGQLQRKKRVLFAEGGKKEHGS